MTDYRARVDRKAAHDMLDAFASAGAESFDLTITTRQGEKHRFQRHLPPDRLRESIPALLEDAAGHEHNVIVRPHSARTVFIQLDDLSCEAVERIKPAAFLSLHTSPGNYQAWVALKAGDGDKDFARRLRKGAGADDTASGATRVAGSLNFKDKYAPDFPRVEINHVTPGLITDAATLEKLGLVAAPEQPAPASFRVSPPRSDNRKWPSYQRCVQGAPENRDKTGPDVSRADFTWCMTAITWGWSVEDTSVRLMEESAKARENGERYALMTAQNAAAAVERRNRSRA
jgi:hypothetical protein